MPDEKQHMRIRLKVALLDVRSGNWAVFSPKPFADARLTASPGRGDVDQKQVERLKQLAYEAPWRSPAEFLATRPGMTSIRASCERRRAEKSAYT